MRLFLPEESRFFFSRFFVRVTNPLLRLFKPITPEFLVAPLVPFGSDYRSCHDRTD
jgi:hypothetical protein